MRRSVNSWRWPILRREFLRRRFLNAMILPPRPCSSTWAATVAPATIGAPSFTLSPPTTSTSPNSTISPGSPLILSTLSTSSVATRYCLPPVLKTANIFFPRVRFPVLGTLPDRLFPVDAAVKAADFSVGRQALTARLCQRPRSYDRAVNPCQENEKQPPPFG